MTKAMLDSSRRRTVVTNVLGSAVCFTDSQNDEYWGTDKDWEEVNRSMPLGPQIAAVADYMERTGQASA